MVYAGDGKFRYQEDLLNMVHVLEDLKASGWRPGRGLRDAAGRAEPGLLPPEPEPPERRRDRGHGGARDFSRRGGAPGAGRPRRPGS